MRGSQTTSGAAHQLRLVPCPVRRGSRATPVPAHGPTATGRPAAHHCEYEPGYSARSSPMTGAGQDQLAGRDARPAGRAPTGVAAPPGSTPCAANAAAQCPPPAGTSPSASTQVAGRQVHRPGDVPGDRVQRLDLAAEARRRPARRAAPPVGRPPARRPRRCRPPACRRAGRSPIPEARTAGGPLVDRTAGGDPGGEPAVQHAHLASARTSAAATRPGRRPGPVPPSYTTTLESSSIPAARQAVCRSQPGRAAGAGRARPAGRQARGPGRRTPRRECAPSA